MNTSSFDTKPHLKPTKSFFMTEHWVQIYSNQREIKYISHSNIRASVETHPPKLHNLLRFFPLFHPRQVMDLPHPRLVLSILYFLCETSTLHLDFEFMSGLFKSLSVRCAVPTSPRKGETAVYGYDPALFLVLSVSC